VLYSLTCEAVFQKFFFANPFEINRYSNIFGSVRTIPGKRAMRILNRMSTQKNGIVGLISFETGIPLMLDPIYRQSPTGGVTCPIINAETSTIPKCRRSSLKLCATGIRMGTRSTRAEVGVRKHPTIREITITENKNISPFGVMERNALLRYRGIFSILMIHPKPPVIAMRSTTLPESLQDLTKTAGSSDRRGCL